MYRNCIVALNNLHKEQLLIPPLQFLALSARSWLATSQPRSTLSQTFAQCAALLGFKDILYNYLVNLSYQLQIVQEHRDGVLDTDYQKLCSAITQLLEIRSEATLTQHTNSATSPTPQPTSEIVTLPDGLYDPLQVQQFLAEVQPLVAQLQELNQQLEVAVEQLRTTGTAQPQATSLNQGSNSAHTSHTYATLHHNLLALNAQFQACFERHNQSMGQVVRDVRDLFAHFMGEPALGYGEITLEQLSTPTSELAAALEQHYEEFVEGLVALYDRNVPFERILGYSEILRVGKLELNDACLIPRFDTYNLICEAFGQELRQAFIKFLVQRQQTGNTTFRILDLGAGTGLMGLSLLEHLRELFAPNCVQRGQRLSCLTPPPNIQIELHYVDLNPAALEVAVRNAQIIYQDFPHVTIHGHLSDWYGNLPKQLLESFAVILSNPPYLAPDDPHFLTLLDDEPQMALVAPESGLAFYRTIITQAPRWLASHGILCLEHGHTQSQVISAMFNEQWSVPQVGYDLGTTTKRGLLSHLL